MAHKRRKKQNRSVATPNKPPVPPAQDEIKHAPHNLEQQKPEPSHQLVFKQQTMTMRSGYSPDELRELDKLVPGFAGSFLDEKKREGEHRRSMENRALELHYKNLTQGRNAGIVVAAMLLGVAAFTAFKELEFATTVIGGSTVIGVIAAFSGVYLWSRSKDPENEADEAD